MEGEAAGLVFESEGARESHVDVTTEHAHGIWAVHALPV